MFPNYLRSQNTETSRFVFWQTGHYKYQIEMYDRDTGKLIVRLNRCKSYEDVSRQFDTMVNEVIESEEQGVFFKN